MNALIPSERGRRLPRRLPRGFVELLGRSNFSFLQGASHPEEMVEQALLHEYSGFGLCDLNGLYGVVKGFEAVHRPSHFVASVHAEAHFRYVIGSEILLADASSVVLMPLSKVGYGELCRLLTLGKRRAEKGFSKLFLDDVLADAQNCLVFPMPPWTDERMDQLIETFGDRLYLPVWKDLTWESLTYYQDALRYERERGVKLFVTQRPFMHHRSRKPLFDVLTCLLHQTTLEEAKSRLAPNAERVLRPLAELYNLWQERPDLVERTIEIADRVNFSLTEIRYRYPQGHLPEGRTPAEQLRFLTEEGLNRRYPDGVPPKVWHQAMKELRLLVHLNYEDYLLTLQEICAFAVEKGILFQGRGSAANSVVCFAIGLTAVNPTQVNLLFERFVSQERNEPPDIDIDFEHERREEVIQHIYQKYGAAHAAMVCNVIRYRSRLAFREAAKVFGVPLKAVNAAIKHMGRDGLGRLEREPLDPLHLDVPADTWKLVLKMAIELHGFPRHLSIHSGGFVITQNPLHEMVPVEKATMEGRYVVQWNKDDVNTLGLLKIDLLSLGMLSALRRCRDLLEKHKSLRLDLAKLPADDPETYDMICEADTVGVFQIESRAQMMTLPRMKPRNYYDLVIEVAIVRPGPLQGGMVHPYLRRRAGLERVTYPDPDLHEVLGRTMGVPLFQEQIMQIAVISAGFTPGEADELRRLMTSAWKKNGVMEGVRDKVMTGLARKGLAPEFAEQIYGTIQGFSSYGFPESHAASFALLTYASSYIKCHHADVFTCALLNSQPMGFYSPRALLADAQRHGVVVRDIDINHSDWESSLEDPAGPRWLALRLGFHQISGFSQEAGERVARERLANGPYTSLSDLFRRTALMPKYLRMLTSAGACGSLGRTPRELLWEVQSLEIDPNSLFYGHGRAGLEPSRDVELPAETPWDEVKREYKQKGLSVHLHALSALRPGLDKRGEQLRAAGLAPYVTSADLPAWRNRTKLRVAGLMGITQRPPTAKGFCFITLEDEFGTLNIVVPPDLYQRDRAVIYGHSLIEVQGTFERTGENILNIRAERVLPLLRPGRDDLLAAAERAGLAGGARDALHAPSREVTVTNMREAIPATMREKDCPTHDG